MSIYNEQKTVKLINIETLTSDLQVIPKAQAEADTQQKMEEFLQFIVHYKKL